MLRWTLALVIVANLLFLAWRQHWLAPLGLAPMPEGEPERLQQQVHPDAIVLRPVRPENAIVPAATPTPGADETGHAAEPAPQPAPQPTAGLAGQETPPSTNEAAPPPQTLQ